MTIPPQITGADIYDALDSQIRHYDVHKSLFDVVMAAVCRFSLLILFYAILSLNHWWVIAVSLTMRACPCSTGCTNCFRLLFAVLYDRIVFVPHLQGVRVQREYILATHLLGPFITI